MKRNASRLEKLYNYMGVSDELTGKHVIERSFFLGNTGYFLFSTKAHAIFLASGKSSIEKLQKKGWLRILVRDKEVAKELYNNKFILFYDKNGLVCPHNELNFLKHWNNKPITRSRAENYKLNEKLYDVPQEVLYEALDKVQRWNDEGAEYFGLPADWDSIPLDSKIEEQILKPVMPARKSKKKTRKSAKTDKSSADSYTASMTNVLEDNAPVYEDSSFLEMKFVAI